MHFYGQSPSFYAQTLNERSPSKTISRRSFWNILRAKHTLSSAESQAICELERGGGLVSLTSLKEIAEHAVSITKSAHKPHPKYIAVAHKIWIEPVHTQVRGSINIGQSEVDGSIVNAVIRFAPRADRRVEAWVIAHEIAHYLLRFQDHEHVDVQMLTLLLLCHNGASPHAPKWCLPALNSVLLSNSSSLAEVGARCS